MASPNKEINLYFQVKKTISMKVKRSDSIRDLKVMIHKKEGILEDLQDLFFAGNWLDKDDLRVMDYGIPENSTINLVHQESSQIQLCFKAPFNEKFELEVQKNDTIQNIKSIIQTQKGIHPSKYAIYYDGKPLENYRTLASLKIQSTATLQMISTPKEMQTIFVESLTGEIIDVEVKCTHTIHDIKKVIESMTNVPSEDFELFIGTEKLRDLRTLAFYDITYLDKIHINMVRVSGSRYKILVKCITGKTIILDVSSLDTVLDLKEKLFLMEGTPVNEQRIGFNNKYLEDHRTLADYNVGTSSQFDLIPKLFSGPYWRIQNAEQQVRQSNG